MSLFLGSGYHVPGLQVPRLRVPVPWSQNPPGLRPLGPGARMSGLGSRILRPMVLGSKVLGPGSQVLILYYATETSLHCILKTKANSNFALELAERSNRFFLWVWWVTLFKHLYFLVYDWVSIGKTSEAAKRLFQ